MRFVSICILLMLAGLTGSAFASNVAASADPSLSDTAKLIFDAVMHSNWWAAAAYGVILATIGARKVMPASWKEGVKGDIVGTASAFVLAFAGAVATAVAAPGAAVSAGVFLTALKIGAVAIGGYTAIHKVVGWLAAWGKLPAWVLPVLKLLASLVGSSAIKKAEAAGAKAVAADPPKGMKGDSAIVEVE